jgi:hypothetical protein
MPGWFDVTIVLISGWSASHCVTFRFQLAHSACFRSGATGTARESGQLGWSSDTADQLSAFAARKRAARQWPAWLSPTRATVGRASEAGGPNVQAMGASVGAHGVEVISRACAGVGTTIFRSLRLVQRCTGSREAAPKQAGRAAAVPVTTARRPGGTTRGADLELTPDVEAGAVLPGATGAPLATCSLAPKVTQAAAATSATNGRRASRNCPPGEDTAPRCLSAPLRSKPVGARERPYHN